MDKKKAAAWRGKTPETTAYRASNNTTAEDILPRAGLNCQEGGRCCD